MAMRPAGLTPQAMEALKLRLEVAAGDGRVSAQTRRSAARSARNLGRLLEEPNG
jgi:hypothetical protein